MQKFYINTLFLFLISLNSLSAPNSGTLLNFENELERLDKLPNIIPDESNLINGDPSGNGEKILVREFRFSGKTNGISDNELKEVLKDFINTELSFAEIQLAAKKIQDYFRSKGYFIAQAFIPEQEVKEGVIEIFISEGKLDSKQPFELKKNNLRLKDNIPVSYFIESLNGKLTMENLERAILNLNDVPGVQAKVSLKQGDDPLSTKIVIETQEDSILSSRLILDNYGNRYTGQNRATGILLVNNPSKSGDQIIYKKTYAPTGNFDLNSVSYNFPLGRKGLRLGLSINDLDYKIAKELKTDPMSAGDAQTFSVNIKYPLIRTSKRTALIYQDFTKKYLYNETTGVVSSDKEIENFTSSLSIQYIDNFLNGGLTQFSLDQAFGSLNLEGSASDFTTDQGASGAKTDGNFNKTNMQIYRLQRIVDKLNIQILGSLQFASKNLDSSEKFTLGGISGIRAFPSGEASGDEGKKISYELKYELGSFINIMPESETNFSVFYDYGSIKQYKELLNISLSTPNKYSLKGWGAFLDIFNSDLYNFKIGWANSIAGNPGKTSTGNNSDGKDSTSRYWFYGSLKLN